MPLLGFPTDREINASPSFCGSSITLIGGESHARDEAGHPVAYVHVEFVTSAVAVLGEVERMHRPDPVDIVPWCPTCNVAAPCPTAHALGRMSGAEPGAGK